MTEQLLSQSSAARPQLKSARLVLYGSPHSQFTYKVALMLRLASVPFSFRYVSFRKGEHRSDAFLKMSRWGQVPVLQDDARTLVQSAAILEYLAERTGAFQCGADERWTVCEWLHWDADRLAGPVYACYGAALRHSGLLAGTVDDAIERHYRELALAGLASLDAQLCGRTWLVGDGPTIADLSCYADVVFAGMCGLAVDSLPGLRRWVRQVAGLRGADLPLQLLPMQDAEFD